jgi:AraC-like DNA-binding protein
MLWQHVRDGDADPLASEECAVRLLRGVVQAARGDSAPHGERGRAARIRRRHRVARAKEAIVREPARRWSLSELADCASMSPYHLAHVFRDEVGTSVFDYVIRTRLVHALEKVLDSDCDLTSVALEAGFASHSHFTARFRALFGRTPSELRHSLKRSLADELRKIRAVS